MAAEHEDGGSSEPRRVIRTVIVDDHHAFADLLALALSGEPDFEIVGCADGVAKGVALAVRTAPDLVVMDIELGADDGIVATRRIRAESPGATVVMVTAHADGPRLRQAADAGAAGIVPKSGSLQEMLEVLRKARNGAIIISPSLLRSRRGVHEGEASRHAQTPLLTGREQEVLTLMDAGLSPRDVAAVLGISLHTSRGYVKSIHAKLGVRSQLEVVARARQLGLLAASGWS